MTEVFFDGISREITKLLNSAQSSIKIAIAWFTQEELFNILLKKLENKVDITILLIDDGINFKNGGLNFNLFIQNGGKVFLSSEDHPMHNKFCIIDDSILINGSYNWTYSAEYYNWENIIIHRDRAIVKLFNNEFELIKANLTRVHHIVNHDELLRSIASKEYLALDYIAISKKYDELGQREKASFFRKKSETLSPSINKYSPPLQRSIKKSENKTTKATQKAFKSDIKKANPVNIHKRTNANKTTSQISKVDSEINKDIQLELKVENLIIKAFEQVRYKESKNIDEFFNKIEVLMSRMSTVTSSNKDFIKSFIYYLQALVSVNKNQFTQAISYAESSIAQLNNTENQDIKGHSINIIGLAKLAKQDYNGAITAFDHALEGSPKNPNIYWNKGVCYFNKQHDLNAIQAFDTAYKFAVKQLQSNIKDHYLKLELEAIALMSSYRSKELTENYLGEDISLSYIVKAEKVYKKLVHENASTLSSDLQAFIKELKETIS